MVVIVIFNEMKPRPHVVAGAPKYRMLRPLVTMAVLLLFLLGPVRVGLNGGGNASEHKQRQEGGADEFHSPVSFAVETSASSR